MKNAVQNTTQNATQNTVQNATQNATQGSIKTIIVFAVALIALSLAIVFVCQGVQDKAIVIEEQINSAISDINVQEKRREDLIPNLVECVKQYDEHEYETLMAVVEARKNEGENEGSSDSSVQEIQTMIQAVAENYPELKSNENYKELMNELSATENLIANYRSNYNKFVKEYNQYTRKFFNRTILSILGYENKNYEMMNFEVSHDSPDMKNLFESW